MKNKRDALVAELEVIQERQSEIRKEIEKLETNDREKIANAMIGKCYVLLFESDSKEKEPTMFGRVESHCQNGRVFQGTEINLYRSNKKDIENNLTCEGDYIQVSINKQIYYSYIENGYEITKEEFNKLLEEAICGIKLSK